MKNLYVVDFDIGHGKRYINLLHELHTPFKSSPATLNITIVVDNSNDETLKMVEDNFNLQTEHLRTGFALKVMTLKITELTLSRMPSYCE
ncbi:hypothetical protein RYX36_011619 [Vicia faba]